MTFADLTRARYSCRHFEDRPVPTDMLTQILEAGRIAPSACNNHPTRVIACTAPRDRERACAATKRFAQDGSVFGAPVVLIVCAKTDVAWTRKYDQLNASPIDTAIVCDQMMMQAVELGLGTCWVCHFNPEVIREQFNLPEDVYPYHMLPLGYPSDTIAAPEKREARTIPMTEFLDVYA